MSISGLSTVTFSVCKTCEIYRDMLESIYMSTVKENAHIGLEA
jgi:hypothetical protein